MSDNINALHRKFAVSCFNGAWDLIDKADRTPEEATAMIHMAHASRYHWGQSGTPLNFARGDWQISRVYAVLGQGQNALTYANNCLHTCLENNIGDFDLAFGYEAAARAFSILGDAEMTQKHLDLARRAGETIEKEDDKKYLLSELDSIMA